VITLRAFCRPEWAAPFLGVGVFCSAYLSIPSGPPDLFAQALLGYGLFQALVLIRLIPWIGGIAAGTLWLLLRGRLLPPPLQPPPESLHPPPRVI
jgi:tellurite resistance protein TehA-like permease